ncbi:DUF4136 domain-containing protein [Cerasicoccus arenae]|uniref:DUF4136 domain-containing protein n=2 Tax=Cerasicoccus arenae TaxID=424488 RepID=A0A8J3DE12_9BACT|nr:DUF4136 domain-containing protein [Cerasicoccus arenae]MBK1859910.1 DUF4136 domain-containing protein [Cerasicoccus arenae]GHC12750.1 hypothetical protein GCM10007047_32700 [Cerasicoccus arenae]
MLGACTTVPKVQTRYSPSADFSDVKTFAVLPMPTQITGAEPGVMVELAAPAKAAIIADMEAKGYQQAPVETADITVGLHGELLPRTQVINTGYMPQTYSDPWLNSYPYQQQQIVRNYDQGTLALEISRQGKLDWVGWSTQKRAPGATINTDNVIAGIHEILADFPPDEK